MSGKKQGGAAKAGAKAAQPQKSLFLSALQVVLAILALLVAFIVYRVYSLHPDQPFALSTHLEQTHNPPSSFIRHVINEYTVIENRTFIQWWNYAIVDAETKVHWTIAFGIATVLYEPEKRVGSFSYIQRRGTEVLAEISCKSK